MGDMGTHAERESRTEHPTFETIGDRERRTVRTATKKPIPVKVQQFDPDDQMLFWYRRRAVTGDYEVFNALHSSWIGLKPGDWVNVTDKQDHYPIDQAVFDATYDLRVDIELD